MRLVLMLIVLAGLQSTPSDPRPRARDLGIAPGAMDPGALNAITDVPGVLVGQVTVRAGDHVRTGVTAILPHGGNLFRDKVPGAVFVGNAFGKLAGSTQVEELGTIESPIVLTNTLSVGAALDAVVRWTVAQPGNENVRSVNGLVGETNDGSLNDIRGFHVTREHVTAAIAGAKSGAVEEGAVGAGTGTVAFGWKGGIGTSSRLVRMQDATYTIGVLVQSNYGGKLTIAGVPVWKELTPRGLTPGENPRGLTPAEIQRGSGPLSQRGSGPLSPDGSCMIVVATDAPLDARDLERLAARAIFALARTGSTYSNGSGDFAIAFGRGLTPAEIQRGSGPLPADIQRGSGPLPAEIQRGSGPLPQRGSGPLSSDVISPLFEAVLDATEEAVYNSMLKAVDTTGNGRTVRALPIDRLRALLKKYGR